MALNENAIFTASTGYVFTAPVATAKPTPSDLTGFTTGSSSLPAPWVDLGHTSRDDLPEFGFEGGEIETRGSWRNATLREVTTEVAVDYVIVRLQQFDEEGLSLYYGVNNSPDATAGEFIVTGGEVLTATERALAIVIQDGPRVIAFYAPKASIRREEELTMAVDDFAVLPLRCTFLTPGPEDDPTNSLKGMRFAWIAADTSLFGPQGS